MICATICVTIFLIFQPAASSDMKKSSDKYGPYTISRCESQICKGPKTVDQAVASAAFNTIEDNIIIGSFFYNVSETAKMTEMKITVYSLKNNKKSVMWNYKLTDPCKHYAVGVVLSQHLNIKPENCIVKPGIYHFDLNASETAQTFFGHSFFYGDYTFKLISLSKKGNLGCLMIRQVFEKKVNNTNA